MSRIACSIISVILCVMFFLTGCSKFAMKNSDSEDLPTKKATSKTKAEKPTETSQTKEPVLKHHWVIKIEETITAPYLGELGGQSEILSENKMSFLATNDNDNPYDGEFTGTAFISSFTDLKKQMGVDNTEYLNLKNNHEAHDFKFTLKPSNLSTLIKDKALDDRLNEVASSEFFMPTKGDNPATVFGSAEGFQFEVGEKLDFSLKCDLNQTNNKITLQTDMFGTFSGTIEWVADKVEIAPLNQN